MAYILLLTTYSLFFYCTHLHLLFLVSSVQWCLYLLCHTFVSVCVCMCMCVQHELLGMSYSFRLFHSKYLYNVGVQCVYVNYSVHVCAML